MECVAFFAGLVVIAVVAGALAARAREQKLAQMAPDERDRYLADQRAQEVELQLLMQWGAVNPAMLCPHCQTKGAIRTKAVVQKKGISGGKATAALLTGGFSVLATGLSRKEGATQAHCDACNNTWVF